jgi:hypothetical protein
MSGTDPVIVKVDAPRVEGTISLEDIAGRLEAARGAGTGDAQSEQHPLSKVVGLAKDLAAELDRLHPTARPDRLDRNADRGTP